MPESSEDTCDLIVVGSGAAGFSAAITGANAGLRVVMVEKAAVFGGTTAFSGGFMWIPDSSLAKASGVRDSRDDALTYIHALAGEYHDAGVAEAFLDAAPEMLDAMLGAGLKVRHEAFVGDFVSELPGARRGRSISPLPVNASILGPAARDLRPPLPETTFLGIRIASGDDMNAFLNVTRSFAAARHVAKRMIAHAWDLLRHGRTTECVNGHALIAQLAAIAFAKGVTLRLGTAARRLVTGPDGVAGVEVESGDRVSVLRARKGVVLAGGGFSHDLARRAAHYPHPAGADRHFPLPPETNTGDSARMAEALGGEVASNANPGSWMPVTQVRARDGSLRPFMHSFSAARGGFIMVTPEGRRFVNESLAWHQIGEALVNARGPQLPAEAFLIGNHRAVRRWGLGFAKPFPVPLWPYIRSGHVIAGRTIAELARKTGIDAAELARTVERFNGYAASGEDPEFARGASKFSRALGDPAIKPNPTLAPLTEGPFYAVKVLPGDIGTMAGLRADGQARVLDRAGKPIPRLYVAGNDMRAVFGGGYPGGGGTIGPAMTLGFIAARDAAKLPDASDAPA